MSNEDKPWTKKELSLRPGPIQLACAVIEQWKLDGCPVADLEGIAYWTNIVKQWNKEQDKKHE